MLPLDCARILKVSKTLAVGGRLGWNYETLNVENRASQHALTALVKVANRILFARLQETCERIPEKVNKVQLLVK
jgi:hypothetical protein